MDNQHRKISGYRELDQVEIDMINAIKAKGAEMEFLIARLRDHVRNLRVQAQDNNSLKERLDQSEPERWLAIGKTDLQTGLSALTRAVAQPGFF